MHFPHPINKKIKRVTRLVILPDYQGIGLGTKFLNFIADFYAKQGFDFRIVTSAKNLIYALNRNKNWALQRYEKEEIPKGEKANKALKRSIRTNVKTASFLFVK